MINIEKFLSDPWGYFQENRLLFNNTSSQLIFEIILDRYTNLLNLYLNNPCGIKDIIIKYRSDLPVSKWLRKEIETLFLAVQEIYSEKYKISEPSINLSLVHNILSKNIPNIQTKFEEIHCNNKKPHGIARKIINKIENLIKTQLANQNISFITIGSMADGNYIWEWSDYDAIIILNDEILEENNLRTIQSKIFNLRMILYILILFRIMVFSFLI